MTVLKYLKKMYMMHLFHLMQMDKIIKGGDSTW